jgi:DNA polymerase eta
MRGDEAKQYCPDIGTVIFFLIPTFNDNFDNFLELVSLPCVRGKADLTKYRNASEDVAKEIQKYTQIYEKASINEAYLDITDLVNQRSGKISRFYG